MITGSTPISIFFSCLALQAGAVHDCALSRHGLSSEKKSAAWLAGGVLVFQPRRGRGHFAESGPFPPRSGVYSGKATRPFHIHPQYRLLEARFTRPRHHAQACSRPWPPRPRTSPAHKRPQAYPTKGTPQAHEAVQVLAFGEKE